MLDSRERKAVRRERKFSGYVKVVTASTRVMSMGLRDGFKVGLPLLRFLLSDSSNEREL